jgi:hypothetical protein
LVFLSNQDPAPYPTLFVRKTLTGQTAGVARRTPAIGAFSTDGVAKEHRQKINHVILPETPSRKVYSFADRGFGRHACEDAL